MSVFDGFMCPQPVDFGGAPAFAPWVITPIPTGIVWVGCPTCGSGLGVKRLGRVGVPDSMLGKRKRTSDSTTFYCEYCKKSFRSHGESLSEAFGGAQE